MGDKCYWNSKYLNSITSLDNECIGVIHTDKVYKNNEWAYGYREIDPLGGHDPCNQ